MTEKSNFEKFKKEFQQEFSKINDIEELKKVYSIHLAKREEIIDNLRKENQILLKTAFKNKKTD